jgi:hypothetical protein
MSLKKVILTTKNLVREAGKKTIEKNKINQRLNSFLLSLPNIFSGWGLFCRVP